MPARRTPAMTDRPLRADARRNYDRLVAEAQVAFAEHGADTLLDDIARRAGLGVGTLYRHFPTREALLGAVVQEWTASVRTEAEMLTAQPDAAHALATWLRSLVRHMGVYRGLVAAMAASMEDSASALHPSCQVIADAGELLVTHARRQGAIREDVSAAEVLQMVTGLVWVCEQQPSADLSRLLRLALDSLRPPPHRG